MDKIKALIEQVKSNKMYMGIALAVAAFVAFKAYKKFTQSRNSGRR